MIDLQAPDRDPIETALIAWLPAADLYRDGQLVHTRVNFLGGNEVVGKTWSTLIAAHLREHGPDQAALIAYLQSRDVAGHVRTGSQTATVAESIIRHLTERGLL